MSSPELTLPFTIRASDALWFRSPPAVWPRSAAPVSAARSPDWFTSNRWKPLCATACRKEGRPLAELCAPRPPPLPAGLAAAAAGAWAGVLGFASAVAVKVVGAGAVVDAAGAVAGVAAAGGGAAAAASAALRASAVWSFNSHWALGASESIPTSLPTLVKPSMSTSMVHTPSARSGNE